MRVLVTGAASLTGSLLCELLLGEGHEVVAIDDFSSGSFANLKRLTHDRRFAFVEHDVAKPFDAEVEAVLHLAVPSTRRRCEVDVATSTVTCAAGTKNVLDVAARRGARVVVGASEERWGFGLPAAQAIVDDFVRRVGLDVGLAWTPATFGPRMDPDRDHPVSGLLLRKLAGEPLLEPGKEREEPRLRVAWAADVARAFSEIMARAAERGRIGASDRLEMPAYETTLAELGEAIADACGDAGSGTGVVADPLARPNDLRDAITITVRWFRARIGRRTGRASGFFPNAPPDHEAKRLVLWRPRVRRSQRRGAR